MYLLQQLQFQYKLEPIVQFRKITSGKTASTYYVLTASNQEFILKSLTSVDSALFEFKLLTHIASNQRDIVSEIVCTIENKPYMQENSTIYQLQKFIPSIKNRPLVKQWLNSYFKLHQTLKNFEENHNPTDRFAIAKLWAKTNETIKLQFPNLHHQLVNNITDWIHLDEQQEEWIHGDLGSWNVLNINKEHVLFIDFSEARRGPKYLDLVALLTSYAPIDKDLKSYLEEFISVYTTSEELDIQLLQKTIELWHLRGILSAIHNNMEISIPMHFLKMRDLYNQLFIELNS